MYILISCQLTMLMPMIPTHDFEFIDLINIPSQRPVFLQSKTTGSKSIDRSRTPDAYDHKGGMENKKEIASRDGEWPRARIRDRQVDFLVHCLIDRSEFAGEGQTHKTPAMNKRAREWGFVAQLYTLGV